MINAVVNAQRGDVSSRYQSVKPLTNHWVPNISNGSTLYWNKWVRLILGCTSPAMKTVFHMKPNLSPIQGQSVFWRKSTVLLYWWPPVPLRPTCLAILAVTQNAKVQPVDTGHCYEESVWWYCAIFYIAINAMLHSIEDLCHVQTNC